MNKKESLAFLQSCIDRINVATDEEIAVLQESYELNCIEFIESSDFQFIPPTDSTSSLYEKNEVREMTIFENECVVERNKVQWKYNVEGTITFNEQGDDNLPYAA